MVTPEYLATGLCALARAHRVNTMSGHLGAAVVAGCFITEQHPDLDDKVCAGIEAELDRIIGGESVFSPGKGAAVSAKEMFKPFAEERPRGNSIDGIAKALARNIDRPRESGHNVIFAAIAIRALTDHPRFATPSVCDGIRRLIAGFDGASPGSGYYGKEKGRVDGREVPLAEDNALPLYPDLETMADAVLDELIRHAPEHRVGFGGLWHIVNHAAALVELERYGYREIAERGLRAHHRHLRLFRTLPDLGGESGRGTPAESDPRAPEFWTSGALRRDGARLTHRIKTLYGFDALAGRVGDKAKFEQANVALRYLM